MEAISKEPGASSAIVATVKSRKATLDDYGEKVNLDSTASQSLMKPRDVALSPTLGTSVKLLSEQSNLPPIKSARDKADKKRSIQPKQQNDIPYLLLASDAYIKAGMYAAALETTRKLL